MAPAPKKEGRRTRAEQRAATLKLILDTSEDLFSQLGYFGVTIKDVADRMGIHPALIHYYFDGKKALFDAVFERRMKYAVVVRTAGLDAYEAEVGDDVTVEGVLRAYYDGAFDVYINGDEGWRNFGRAGQAAGRQGIQDLGHNICFGHTHRLDVTYIGNHVALNAGWLGDVEQIDYAHLARARRESQLGFGLVDEDEHGNVWPQAVAIVDGACRVRGVRVTA